MGGRMIGHARGVRCRARPHTQTQTIVMQMAVQCSVAGTTTAPLRTAARASTVQPSRMRFWRCRDLFLARRWFITAKTTYTKQQKLVFRSQL